MNPGGMLEVLRDKIAACGAANMTPMKLDLAVDPLPNDRFDLGISPFAISLAGQGAVVITPAWREAAW